MTGKPGPGTLEGDPAAIRDLERMTCAAWPAAIEEWLDGWWLRLDRGYTRRPNSVYPLGPVGDLGRAIAHCEARYRSHGLRPTFKLTSAALPAGLERELEARGYERAADTEVEVLEPVPEARTPPAEVELSDELRPGWVETLARLRDETHRREALAAILAQIGSPRCFATRRREGRPVSLGLTVVRAPWAGLFDIVTAPELRRQGHAEALVRALLAEARRLGASRAFLQVEAGNHAALELYGKLGFRPAYRYWYRAAPVG